MTDEAVLAQYAHLVYTYGGRIHEGGGYWPTYPEITELGVNYKTHNGQKMVEKFTPLAECRRVIHELYPDD